MKQVVPDIGSRFKLSTPAPDMLCIWVQSRSSFNKSNFVVWKTKWWSMPKDFLNSNQTALESLGCNQPVHRVLYIMCQYRRMIPLSVEIMGRPAIDSAAFSIVMSGTEARLFISWKHNDHDYFMQKTVSFSLKEPNHFLKFRKFVRNILNWGKDRRLEDIQNSLDAILEDNRKTASQLAKSRPRPSDDCASRHKRRKRDTKGVQEQPGSFSLLYYCNRTYIPLVT